MQHYWVMPLEAPHIEAYKPQPVKPEPVIKVKREVVKESRSRLKSPSCRSEAEIYTTAFTAPVVKLSSASSLTSRPMCIVAKAFPDPTPALSLGSSAIPTIKKPERRSSDGWLRRSQQHSR